MRNYNMKYQENILTVLIIVIKITIQRVTENDQIREKKNL